MFWNPRKRRAATRPALRLELAGFRPPARTGSRPGSSSRCRDRLRRGPAGGTGPGGPANVTATAAGAAAPTGRASGSDSGRSRPSSTSSRTTRAASPRPCMRAAHRPLGAQPTLCVPEASAVVAGLRRAERGARAAGDPGVAAHLAAQLAVVADRDVAAAGAVARARASRRSVHRDGRDAIIERDRRFTRRELEKDFVGPAESWRAAVPCRPSIPSAASTRRRPARTGRRRCSSSSCRDRRRHARSGGTVPRPP